MPSSLFRPDDQHPVVIGRKARHGLDGHAVLAGHIRQELDALHALITQNGWNTDEPLKPGYLHYFYLYSDNDHRKDD